jgi:hypothetical protein
MFYIQRLGVKSYQKVIGHWAGQLIAPQQSKRRDDAGAGVVLLVSGEARQLVGAISSSVKNCPTPRDAGQPNFGLPIDSKRAFAKEATMFGKFEKYDIDLIGN